MAKITINIPADKEQWVLDGFVIRFGYETMVENPEFNDILPVDSETNPLSIENPETIPQFAKRMVINMIKNEAFAGHNQVSQEANAVIANEVNLD